MGRGWGHVTLRAAAPLPRRVPSTGGLQQELPSYRVIIEAYPAPVDGKETRWCNVGFVPSHTSTDGAPVTPVIGYGLHHYCTAAVGCLRLWQVGSWIHHMPNGVTLRREGR
jgi:hypothetical protein